MSKQDTLILSIPVELRLKIYDFSLDLGGSFQEERRSKIEYLMFMSVCRQIRKEGMPLFMQKIGRSLYSLHHCIEWAIKGNPALLGQVEDIDLTCDERDWRLIGGCSNSIQEDKIHPFSKELLPSVSWESRYRELYNVPQTWDISLPEIDMDSEDPSRGIQLVWNSLALLHGVKTCKLNIERRFQIGFDSSPESELPGMRLLLEMIRQVMTEAQLSISINFWAKSLSFLKSLPSLRSLTFHRPVQSLEFLRDIPSIRTLRFREHPLPPFDPKRALQLMRGLEYLEILELPSCGKILGVDGPMAFTPEVLKNIHPLKGFKMESEVTDIKSHFFTVAMFEALRVHADTLQSLELRWLDGDPVWYCGGWCCAMEPDAFEALLETISSAKNLRALHLSLQVPSQYKSLYFYEYLPKSFRGNQSLDWDKHANFVFEDTYHRENQSFGGIPPWK